MRNFKTQVSISVSIEELISKLQENKTKHIEKHAKAFAAWKSETLEFLANQAVRVNNGEKLKTFCHDRPPEDMTEEYETAIEMFQWHTERTVTLDAQQFAAFIQDDWDWTSSWHVSNSKYLSR